MGTSYLHSHERACWAPRTLKRLFEIGNVEQGDSESCWEWHGSRDRWGYGRINGTANPVRVCRVVVELTIGRELRRDEEPRHSCDYPPCCNPAHLQPGTRLDNVRDMIARGRQGGVQTMTFEERSALWDRTRRQT